MSDADEKREEDLAVLGRRKLMKLGVYAAPVILGTLTISRAAQAGSPLPCVPNGSPCSPDGSPCQPTIMSCMPS
jgi:hypothetical protein